MLRLMERRHSLYGQKSDACVGLQERGVWKPSDFVFLTIYLRIRFAISKTSRGPVLVGSIQTTLDRLADREKIEPTWKSGQPVALACIGIGVALWYRVIVQYGFAIGTYPGHVNGFSAIEARHVMYCIECKGSLQMRTCSMSPIQLANMLLYGLSDHHADFFFPADVLVQVSDNCHIF